MLSGMKQPKLTRQLLCEWVAGRKVRAGEVLVLTQDEAEYELARGLIREIGAQKLAETAALRRLHRGK